MNQAILLNPPHLSMQFCNPDKPRQYCLQRTVHTCPEDHRDNIQRPDILSSWDGCPDSSYCSCPVINTFDNHDDIPDDITSGMKYILLHLNPAQYLSSLFILTSLPVRKLKIFAMISIMVHVGLILTRGQWLGHDDVKRTRHVPSPIHNGKVGGQHWTLAMWKIKLVKGWLT